MRNLGISGGAAAMAAIVASQLTRSSGAPGDLGNPQAFAQATRDAYLVMAGLALAAAVLSLWQVRVEISRSPRGRGQAS
jgi:hypothetical protein